MTTFYVSLMVFLVVNTVNFYYLDYIAEKYLKIPKFEMSELEKNINIVLRIVANLALMVLSVSIVYILASKVW